MVPVILFCFHMADITYPFTMKIEAAGSSESLQSYLPFVYDTQNYWVSGLYPSSRILNIRKHNILHLFPSSGEGRETPTLLGPLDRANLKHCIQQSRCLPPLTWGWKQMQNVMFSNI
jgi:hypothetical protein